jgi:hypothetical protein
MLEVMRWVIIISCGIFEEISREKGLGGRRV